MDGAGATGRRAGPRGRSARGAPSTGACACPARGASRTARSSARRSPRARAGCGASRRATTPRRCARGCARSASADRASTATPGPSTAARDASRRADARVDARASGTTARFLTAAATLAAGPDDDRRHRAHARAPDRATSPPRCARSARASRCSAAAGCPPVRVAGGGLPGGRARIDARRSSQYVSGVLLAAPCARARRRARRSRTASSSRAPSSSSRVDVMRAFGAERRARRPAAAPRRGARPYAARELRDRARRAVRRLPARRRGDRGRARARGGHPAGLAADGPARCSTCSSAWAAGSARTAQRRRALRGPSRGCAPSTST